MRNLAAAVEALFEPASTRRTVGVELELLVYHDDRTLPVTIAEASVALAAEPTLALEANVTFEPGGQVELSPAADTDVERLLDQVEGLAGRVSSALAAQGISAVLEGTDAWRANDAVGLQKRSERYLRMQEHFDRVGPWGRRMMRQTAGLQVCVSLERGEAGRQQWLLANLMAPILQAAFANSPALEGRQTGLASTRSAIWQVLDPARTGFSRYDVTADPAEGYLRFAASAARIPITGPADPVATHLSTLFPPVRPRGDYLELRCLDAVALDQTRVAVRLVSRLLHERGLRTRALRMLESERLDLPRLWTRAARLGLADSQLATLASNLFELAELGPMLELVA